MDRIGVLTLPILKTVDRQGVERPEGKRMPVDNEEGRLFFDRHEASLSAAADTPQPARKKTMTIIPDDLDPELMERLVNSSGGPLAQKMGFKFLELSAQRSVATMPVEGNTQVVGLLHGGAHVVLAETLGSVSSAIHAGPGRIAVGIEINATHSRSITAGTVTGTCTALSLGRTLATHEIVMRDEQGRRLSTVRMTNFLRDA